MKKVFITSMVVVAMPFMALAQTNVSATATAATTVTLEDPGLVPGDFFYFLDRWGEDIDSFFTFKPESKAHLAIKHAKERAAELDVVLKTKGLTSPEAQQTKEDFNGEIKIAGSVVADEKAKGNDVTALSQEISHEFEISKDMLKEAYRGHHDDLKGEAKDLHEKLKAAINAGDVAAQAAIEADLKNISTEAALTLNEEGDVENNLDAEKQNFENGMGVQQSAESRIANADRTRAQFVRETSVLGMATTSLTVDTLASFDALFVKAKAELNAGDFEAAKNDAEDAESILQDARQNINSQDIESDFFGSDKKEKGKASDGVHGDVMMKGNVDMGTDGALGGDQGTVNQGSNDHLLQLGGKLEGNN